jgi:hypothetical protein
MRQHTLCERRPIQGDKNVIKHRFLLREWLK